LATKIAKKNLATVYFWFIQHKSANFITLIFVFLSQKIFLIRLSGAPLACRALGQLFSFVPPLITPLDLSVRVTRKLEMTGCVSTQRNIFVLLVPPGEYDQMVR